ncbi:hypothetical protein MSAN_01088300 [Mycena sanguinolenta]|uniref:DUF6533 domain-containing protein n=1 Tax=Mycena sanguinolenta TaxID=230812 RepID=A0A8H7D6N8_9AGAR|nr:hypothetical protein MSAN_01088300 [Mycena sanguinolenta]
MYEDDDDWVPVYLGGELLLLNYLHLVGITVLYWDHLQTFAQEVNLIWSRSKSLSAYCFFVNRYFAFISGIPVAVIPFLSPSTEKCVRLSLFREIVIVLMQVITCAVMIVRVYALYGRNQRVLWFMVGTAACVAGVSIWSFTGQRGSRTLLEGGCHYGLTPATSYRLAGCWEALFGFDVVIFALTIHYAYSADRLGIRQTKLHALLVRHGALYFGIMALSNLANISTFYMVEYWPYLPGALSTFADCISVTVISRLILHMHELANEGILTEAANPRGLSSLDNSRTIEVGGNATTERFESYMDSSL